MQWKHGVITTGPPGKFPPLPNWTPQRTTSEHFLVKDIVVGQLLSYAQLFAPHGLQHTRLPCPSPYPRVCSASCPLSRWCHPTISFSSQVCRKHLLNTTTYWAKKWRDDITNPANIKRKWICYEWFYANKYDNLEGILKYGAIWSDFPFREIPLASVWRTDQTRGKTRGTEDLSSLLQESWQRQGWLRQGSGGRKTEKGSNERVHTKGKSRVSNRVTPQNTDSVNIHRVPDTVCSSQQDRCRVPALVTQLISDRYQSWKLYLCVLSPDPSLVCLPPDTPAQAHPVSYDSLCLLPLMPV